MHWYGCCLCVLLVLYQRKEVEATRHNTSSCSVSTANQSYPSILVTWLAPKTSHGYSVKFWPLYSKTVQESIVYGTTRFVAKSLEPHTLYKVIVRDINSNMTICEVTARTKSWVSSKNHLLRITQINSTHLRASWKKVLEPQAKISYRAFMEWHLSNGTMVELVYHGNETSVMVQRNYLPVKVYVNVLVERSKIAAGNHLKFFHDADAPGIRPTWTVNSLQLVPYLRSHGFDFISITWSPLQSYHGNVTYSVISKSPRERLNMEMTKNHALIGKLQQNTAYTLQVRAHNHSGDIIGRSQWTTFTTMDNNECASDSHGCHERAQCINTMGTYYCRCPVDWMGDGKHCQQITSTNHCIDVIHNGIHWPKTRSGEKALSECPPGAEGNVTRKCKNTNEISEWDEPDYSQCVSKNIALIYEEIQDTNMDPLSNARKLADVTRTNRQTYGTDIHLIVSSLDILSSDHTINQVQYARDSTGNQGNELAMSVLNISSGILDDHVIPSWKQIKKNSASLLANKIIQNLDNIALSLAKNNQKKQTISANTENIALSARVVPVDEGYNGQWLSPTDDMRDGFSSSVYVPGSVLRAQNTEQDGLHYLSLVAYKTIHKVLHPESTPAGSTSKVLSPIVSVTLNPLHKNKFDKPVVLTINRPKNMEYGSPACAFLDISNRSSISWSSEGCQVNTFNETHTQCLCYHLTSFAVLMKVTADDKHSIGDDHHFALSVISYAGLCTSVVALLIVFLTFTLIRFLNLPRHVIHANLALSLAIAHITFMLGINKTESKVLCKSLAILLHYLFLVAFSWMALEGVILYLMLVKVFNTSISTTKTKLLFVACGWGIPVIIVGVSSAIYHQGYGTRDFCWLSLDNHFIWAFVAPVLATITFNFVCLGFTFYIMAKNATRSPEGKVDKLRYWVRSCCLLTCILGVTWLLGVFFVNKQTLFMAYVFSFLNGFQGVMIFLLHCVGDKKIRAVYLMLFKCRAKRCGFSSSSGKGRAGRDSSSEQKQTNKRRLVKQRTVSSLIRSSTVGEVKHDQKPTVQIAERNHERLTSNTTDTAEEVPQSPEKASTPLLHRSKRVAIQQV